MVGHASRVVAVRHVISICALLFACSLTVTHAETSTVLLALPGVKAWTGDFDGMLKRRLIRILVVPSKTYFFLNKGDELGVTAETGQEFEKWINKRHAKPPFDIKVVFVPTRRDRIFQDLIGPLVDQNARVAAQDLLSRLTTLRDRCERRAKSFATPMGDEMLFRYQQSLIDDTTSLLKTLLLRPSSSCETD